VFSFDFWVVLLVFSLGGHTDTYRSGCTEVEHLDYACHPYQIFTKFVCFARVFAVVRLVRAGYGVLSTVLTVNAGSGLQHDAVSTVTVAFGPLGLLYLVGVQCVHRRAV
jgi:hypothetical protein